MTAIAGLVSLDGGRAERRTLERMLTVLRPYGRDAGQIRLGREAGFLRALLRASPEDTLDHQPLVHAQSGRVLLFDGRLDNREELARALDIDASDLRRMADADLLLQACLRWDIEALPRLLGDFALACWVPAEQRLWLARDALGTRPLYWHRQAGSFAFATLPKALFAVPGVEKAISEERLHDYLCLLPMRGPESFFRGVYRVEPGCVLELREGRVHSRRYHSFDPEAELRLDSDEAYVEAFSEQLERAVACRLRSSGPVASHLSSGFDSSTVTALAARQLSAEKRMLFAYTAVPRAGFDGPVARGRHADEGPAAAALAARFPNIEHILIRSGERSALDGLEAFSESLDRPPLNPCNAVWTEAIKADAARRGVRVLLTGAKGNMSISYTGEPHLARLMATGRWLACWREMRALHASEDLRWASLARLSLGPWLPAALWRRLQAWRGDSKAVTDYTAIHPHFLERMRHSERVRDTGWDLSYRPWSDGRRMRIAVIDRLDNGDYFAAANAQGLDMRDPTADRRLIEFCLSVPDAQYLRGGQTRWLLRRAMASLLPPEILHARSRGQQSADWYESTAAALPGMRAELERQKAKGVGRYLDLDAMQAALDAWPESGWAGRQVVQTYRLKLLRGLAVGTFIRQVESDNL